MSQSGGSVSVFDVNSPSASASGTFDGKTLNLSGHNSEGELVTAKGAYSKSSVSGTYSASTDKGTFTLTRPGADVDINGIWIGTAKETYTSYNMPISSTIILSIRQNGESLDINQLGDGEEVVHGYIEGNTFVVESGETKSSGVINGTQLSGYYNWNEDELNGWGTLNGTKHSGNTANANGLWKISGADVYPFKSSSQTFPINMEQSGNNLTLYLPTEDGEITQCEGVIYGNSFVVTGGNMRIDGTISGNKVSGTYDYDSPWEWYWGKYNGSRY